jgi:hypothetical protein
MIHKIAILATAGMFVASVATAQVERPAPGNVNPGSLNSGAEQSGAENQPRSPGGERSRGTTGSGVTAPAPRGSNSGSTRDGINANVKPSSQESGSEPAGEPAPQRR